MAKPNSDALIIALAKKRVNGPKTSKADDYKVIAKDLIAAMKSGDEGKVASVLRAFRDVTSSGGDDDGDE